MMTDTPPPAREKATKSLHALVPPSTHEAFELWAATRGLTASGAVRALVVDALLRELTASPLGPLSRDLPPDTAARIVAHLRDRQTPPTA